MKKVFNGVGHGGVDPGGHDYSHIDSENRRPADQHRFGPGTSVGLLPRELFADPAALVAYQSFLILQAEVDALKAEKETLVTEKEALKNKVESL